MQVKFTLRAGLLTQQLEALRTMGQRPRPLLMAVGGGVRRLLQRHFREKDAREPNQLGGKRQHYYNRVASSTQQPVSDGQTVTIGIGEPTFGHKVRGGTIKPKNARALTIPVTNQAYGMRASVYAASYGVRLFVLKTQSGSYLAHAGVAQTNRQAGTKRGKKLAAMGAASKAVQVAYKLVGSVTQAADPTAMPPAAAVEREIVERAHEWWEQTFRDGGFLVGG